MISAVQPGTANFHESFSLIVSDGLGFGRLARQMGRSRETGFVVWGPRMDMRGGERRKPPDRELFETD